MLVSPASAHSTHVTAYHLFQQSPLCEQLLFMQSVCLVKGHANNGSYESPHLLCIFVTGAEIGFDPTSYSVDEDAGTVSITVVANQPNLVNPVTYYTEDVTATGWFKCTV